ncbi:unnamed protein product [Polarella glacialis]|uniref:Uncharacterized protein n=1 Tax=Polarella glacialis TaxID=89957 RepID=A0A813GSW7_POLGL|nr:unnamed protein product [Polarella glacialis]
MRDTWAGRAGRSGVGQNAAAGMRTMLRFADLDDESLRPNFARSKWECISGNSNSDVFGVNRATGTDFNRVRRQFGAENCTIHWTSTEAFVCSLSPPEAEKDEGPMSVIAGARIFSVMSMSFAPEQVRYTIDDLIFKSPWDAKTGVRQWKVVHIGGPTAPVE